MEQNRRTRGRPRGFAIKPYVKRIPRVIGCIESIDEDLTPVERAKVRAYYAQFEQERQLLCSQSRLGDPVAATMLWTRFRVVVPALNMVHSYVQSYMMGMTLMTTPG